MTRRAGFRTLASVVAGLLPVVWGCAVVPDDFGQRIQTTRTGSPPASTAPPGSGNSKEVGGDIKPETSPQPTGSPFRPTPAPTPSPTPRRTLPPEQTEDPTPTPSPSATPTPTPEPTAFPVDVVVSPSSATLNAQAPGGSNAGGYVSTVQLEAVVSLSDSATNSAVVWTSSDPGRVPVSASGLVTAQSSASAGEVTITATAGNGLTDTAVIHVTTKGRINVIVQ